MGYVGNNLMKDEELVHESHIHWFIFIPSIIFLIFALASFTGYYFLIDSDYKYAPLVPAGIFALMSLISLVKSFLKRKSIEVAVTSKRVIYKTGLISRDTIELNHSKVESFSVEQTIIGRIFDYGTLIINGTGGGKTTIKGLDDPLEFRKEAMQVIDTMGD